MINLQNICLSYHNNIVLDNINLQILEGEKIAIIGGNGTGKSTLMKVIAGELYPTKGKIIFKDRDYTAKNIVQRSHIISRVFQDHMLGIAPHLTVYENLLFASKRNSKRKFRLYPNLKKHFHKVLNELDIGLEKKLFNYARNLSGGQRQALSLIMATLVPPILLILDEHTSALDSNSAVKVMDLTMQLINEHQITSIMITHDIQEAQRFDRILKLEGGNLHEVSQ
jgi:putative ABC transport system ATP-binding protein